ncbi:MAG TPA: phage holin family protein [Steroidobacteraceae bacterium]|nr:phage holin family protein [Steroidobacteraceae bacterium]HNS27885.1 phage holin family protein [Steroidobacteraceae bacterium]
MASPTQRVLEEALSLGAQGLRIAQTRLEILSVDLQREKQAIARQLALAVTCGTSAALAAFACILWVALAFEPQTRFIVLGVLTGVLALVAVACGLLFWRGLQRRDHLFGQLIEALKRDSDALEPRRTRETA